MSRYVPDGLGVLRHLHGFRVAPKDPRRLMRVGAPSADAETAVDVPVFDQIPIFDQGQVGRCTGEVQSRCSSALVLHQTGKLVLFSSMFMYAVSRDDEGTPLAEDSGCMIPDVQASWESHGICPVDAWDSEDFTAEPPPEAKAAAAQYRGQLYYHCPDHATIHGALSQGFGVSIGIAVPESMMGMQCAADGVVHLPEPGERIVGGHDICLRAYRPDMVIDGTQGAYVADNSWGLGWGAEVAGRRGHIILPKAYVERGLATDAESPRSMALAAIKAAA